MIPWFKRHPEYLAREVEALRKDPNYRQLAIARNQSLISHGFILARLDKIHRFPFLIVYSSMTPYALPEFFPLTRTLTQEEVETLSKLSPEQIFPSVKDSIKWYHGLRHQNGSGVLCILEWDNLDDGAKFYGIQTLLSRVKAWCQGTITDEFPPDSQEVEFLAHFNRLDDSISLVYNDIFLRSPGVQGEGYGEVFFRLPKNDNTGAEHKSYVNVLMVGSTAAGISIPVTTMPDALKNKNIFTEEDLLTKGAIVERSIADGDLIKLFWFDILHEPPPFETFADLISIVGEGNFDRGITRMASLLAEKIKSKPSDLLVAIRFPNRKRLPEFQLFRVKKTGAGAALLQASNEETLRNAAPDYQEVLAIRSKAFTDDTYHLRNNGRADRQSLSKKSVNVIGVGALGSEIADIINKAGVGTISLFDNEVLQFDNSIRHLAPLPYAGRNKVDAVRHLLDSHNPFNRVYSCHVNVNASNFFDLVDDISISISTIANDNVEAYLNERAVYFNKTFYYSRALRGGKAARIFRVIPGKDACFNCLQLYRNEGDRFISIPEDEALPTLKTECNNPIRPGSAADLKLISSLTSSILLDELQNGPQEHNQWIWSTEDLPRLPAFQLTRQSLPPHDHCVYCNVGKSAEVFLVKAILTFMQSLVAENNTIETGGVLAGYKDEHGNFHITHASDPGPMAVRSPAKFIKDVVHCQAFLDDVYIRSSGKIVYLGEWHSHPNMNNLPSVTDINSLTEISVQANYLIDNPAMIILSSSGSPSCTIHPAGKKYYHPPFNILP
jgi:integrative and conjugative element protein (TIGR02256 family)